MLLSLYETKIHMLDNPKKKSKMWMSIAEELRLLNVEVNLYKISVTIIHFIYFWIKV